jgi:glycosyltransferase involved in cell wall biosynthesis
MNRLDQLKLCFLAGTLEHGGAERQLFYMLQALRQAGATVRVLSLDRGEFWENKIQALGIPVTWVGEPRSRWKRLLRILDAVRRDRPDVLQSQHFYANAYASIVARIVRAVGIGALRSNGQMEVSESGRLGGWLNLHSPAVIAANSRNALRYAAAHGVPASRLFFLPNVVDTERFSPPEKGSTAPFTLIAVGRLVSEKRFDRFIEIVARLRTVHRLNVRGLIVGHGCPDENLRPDLERKARQSGLFPGHIEFRGVVADMLPLFREADVCVLTSDYEGTPNVLLEAMACGLPVVASDVGGVPEIIRHGQTGFLHAPADLAGFAGSLAALAKFAGARIEMGRRARVFVENNHSLHRLPAYLDSLYQFALPATNRQLGRNVQPAAIRAATRAPDVV